MINPEKLTDVVICVIVDAGKSICAGDAGPDGSVSCIVTTRGKIGGSAVQVHNQRQCRYL